VITTYKGQKYTRGNETPYMRADGRRTAIVDWISNCAECGETFVARTTTAAVKHLRWPNRRCKQCKRPGISPKVR
jgi:hypothetical protein